MTQDEIKKKKEELTNKFNSLEVQRNQYNADIQKVADEQLRLQGEFRLLEELEKEFKK